MAETGMLSDLCSTCHNQKPKYKCPRCSAKTCSLNCVKLHKARAQCSGLRDPTAFVKKSQLVSPAGFDHDYNFLSGLERQMGREGDDLQSRFLQDQPDARQLQRDKQADHFQRRIRDLEVTVIHAPKGMTRQRENQSRLGRKSHEIIWSTEWRLEDGKRCVTNVLNGTAIEIAFRTAARLLGIDVGQTAGQKRKRETTRHTSEDRLAAAEHTDDAADINQAEVIVSTGEPASGLLDGHTVEAENKIEAADDSHLEKTRQLNEADGPYPVNEKKLDQTKTSPEPKKPPLHFYLVQVQTNRPQIVLKPIKSSHSLKTVLEGQVVLEFPTIQVLNHPPESLPASFILAEPSSYLSSPPAAIITETALDDEEAPSAEEEQDARDTPPSPIARRLPNGADLLAILQQDIL